MEKCKAIKTPDTLAKLSVDKLLELFEETSKQDNQDIYTVREWIMNILELKMTEEEFDTWLDA